MSPVKSFPFESAEGIESNCVHPNPEFNLDEMCEFISKQKEKTFCLVTRLIDPHTPWTIGSHKIFDLEKLKLISYMDGRYPRNVLGLC